MLFICTLPGLNLPSRHRPPGPITHSPVGPMPPVASSPSKIAPLFNFQEERILAERQTGPGKVSKGGRRLSRAASLERPLSAVRSPTRSDFSSCYDVVRPSVLIQKAVEHDGRSVGRMVIADDGLCLPNQIEGSRERPRTAVATHRSHRNAICPS